MKPSVLDQTVTALANLLHRHVSHCKCADVDNQAETIAARAALVAVAHHRRLRTFVKTSVDAERRKHRGEWQYRMACDRCGTVRWLYMGEVGTPHCIRGAFMFLLKRDAQ